jgi:hypothetical protein
MGSSTVHNIILPPYQGGIRGRIRKSRSKTLMLQKLQNGSYLLPLKMLKFYKTNEPESPLAGVKFTKRFQAEFSQNRPKGKKFTKQTEAKLKTEKQKLQNKSYLEKPCYKTTSFRKM